jgi:hypothetical protein
MHRRRDNKLGKIGERLNINLKNVLNRFADKCVFSKTANCLFFQLTPLQWVLENSHLANNAEIFGTIQLLCEFLL